jgi:hypothetical protein
MQEQLLLQRRTDFDAVRREQHEQDVASTRGAHSHFLTPGTVVVIKPPRDGAQHHALAARLLRWLKSNELVEQALNGARMEVVRAGKGIVRVEGLGRKFSLPTDVLQRVSGVSLSACRPLLRVIREPQLIMSVRVSDLCLCLVCL